MPTARQASATCRARFVVEHAAKLGELEVEQLGEGEIEQIELALMQNPQEEAGA